MFKKVLFYLRMFLLLTVCLSLIFFALFFIPAGAMILIRLVEPYNSVLHPIRLVIDTGLLALTMGVASAGMLTYVAIDSKSYDEDVEDDDTDNKQSSI